MGFLDSWLFSWLRLLVDCFFLLVSWDDTLLGGDICDGVEARPRPGRRPAVAEMTGDADSDELTEWQKIGWNY